MTTSYKSTKPELIAIYRLEFYKNKKNWKLCHDVKKPLPRSQSPKKCKNLNETYDVEAALDTEQVSLHNKAFLHEEPEDAPDIQAHSDPEDRRLNESERPQYQRSWSEQQQPWTEEKSEVVWQDAQQEWCGVEAEGVPEEIAYPDECDGGPYHQHNMWTPITMNPQTQVNQYEPLKPACDPIEQLEYFSPAELLQTAEEWLQRHGYDTQDDYATYCDQFTMVDNDSTEFVRGAHQAPHSSETDLSVTHDDCKCVLSGALCWLSNREVSSAVRKHAAALRRLLIEHTLRDKLFCPAPLHPALPFEDYPTRDTDPLQMGDCIIAGSHHTRDCGRGRGRLRQGDRVIGIGMGRPYRL